MRDQVILLLPVYDGMGAMLIQVRRYGRHHNVSVVGQVYRRGGRRRGRRSMWRTCLGRCDDEEKRRAMREVVKDYRPLERARIVIEEVEDASGRAQGKGFFRKLGRFR